MSSEIVNLKASGLHTFFQSLMEVPPGALLKANNTVINREGVIEPRRGIKTYGLPFGVSNTRAKELFEYKGRIIRHVEDKLAFDDGTSNFVDFSGSYTEPSAGYRIKSCEAKQNFYFTTSDGVRKISATNSSEFSSSAGYVTELGAPRGLSGSVSVLYDVSGFFPEVVSTSAKNYVSYRIVWTITDKNKNILLGAPSDTMTAENPVANNSFYIQAGVSLTFPVPQGIDSSNYTEYTYRIYRSEIATSTPSDELKLIYEDKLTASQISTRIVSYSDFITETSRLGGVQLYTNENSGEGILAANEKPPIAHDIAPFKGHLFYSNTRSQHSLVVQFLDFNNVILSDPTPSITITPQSGIGNTYTFAGDKGQFRLSFPVATSFTAKETTFTIYSPSNKRTYTIIINRTDLVGTGGLYPNDGRIYLYVNITAADTAATVASKVNTVMNDANFNAMFGLDFSRALATNQITFSAIYAGYYTPAIVPSMITYTNVVTPSGDVASTKTALLSSSSDINTQIEESIKSLVKIINQNSSEVVTAYYVTGGKFILYSKTMDDISFSVGASSATFSSKFSPSLGYGATLTTKSVSKSDRIKNRLYFSKYQEPEAVPFLNFIDIGAGDAEIYRIISLRESLFILKEDGVYRLAGDPGIKPTWDVGAFDLTCTIKALETAITLGNQCYFLSNQGVMRLNESSLESISRSVDNKFIPLFSLSEGRFILPIASFSVAYESDKSFLLWTIKNNLDQKATVCYRYNTVTGTWTEWNISKTCAVLNSHEDKLYFGSGTDNYIEVERKTLTRFDYSDREIPSLLSPFGISGTTLKISNFANLSVGDVVTQTQYVTVTQFNSLLRKLDLDNGLNIHGFYENLKIQPGDSLSTKMIELVTRLNIADPTMGYSFSGATDFPTIQTEFNAIITNLNTSLKTYLSNYKLSSGTVLHETIILSTDTIRKEVSVSVSPSFLIGDLVVYKGISTEIEYAPQHVSEPSTFKQFSSGTFMFERRSFSLSEVAYNSDISDNYDSISITTNSSSNFGTSSWGDSSVWGGRGDQGEIRTLIPIKKQRCRFLGCKFSHVVALETFQLYGLALSVRQYTISDRDYR